MPITSPEAAEVVMTFKEPISCALELVLSTVLLTFRTELIPPVLLDVFLSCKSVYCPADGEDGLAKINRDVCGIVMPG